MQPMAPPSLRIGEVKDAEAIACLVNLAFLAERPLLEGERTNPAGVRDLFAKGEFLLLTGKVH